MIGRAIKLAGAFLVAASLALGATAATPVDSYAVSMGTYEMIPEPSGWRCVFGCSFEQGGLPCC